MAKSWGRNTEKNRMLSSKELQKIPFLLCQKNELVFTGGVEPVHCSRSNKNGAIGEGGADRRFFLMLLESVGVTDS